MSDWWRRARLRNARLAALSTTSPVELGRSRAHLLTSAVEPSASRRSLSVCGAVTMMDLIWFIAAVRSLTAEQRTSVRVRIACAQPSPLLGTTAASPFKAASAAA